MLKAKKKRQLNKAMAEHKIKPGQVTNPTGTNQYTKRAAEIKALYEEIGSRKKLAGYKIVGTVDQAIALSLVKRSLGGDVAAIKEYNDRRWGKAPQAIINEDGTNLLAGLFGVGFMTLGNFTGATPANPNPEDTK